MTFAPMFRAVAIALACAAGTALATPVMEMRADVLMPMAGELRKSLGLSVNQQTLWQQVENRSGAILRARQSRRERLQKALTTALSGAGAPPELRELDASIATETAVSAQEDTQLRELWLGVNDALDEGQRQQVATLLAEQLMRVTDGEGRRAAPRGDDEGRGQHRSGSGKPGRGMGGGMGAPGG